MKNLIIIRGGGDVASGTIYKLYKCGFPVLILETDKPSAIRRHVAFSEAVYEGQQTIEGVTCYRAEHVEEAKAFLEEGRLTLLVDPKGEAITAFKPLAVVDGILAKKNLGTHMTMADIVIGLGPGFEAGKDVHAVIETMRGHDMGRVIYDGPAMANTGVPGSVGGYAKERVIYSPAAGVIHSVKKIGDVVKQGEAIAYVEMNGEVGNDNNDDNLEGTSAVPSEEAVTMRDQVVCTSVPVYATIDGLLRGLIRDGYRVKEGFKIADIDPRLEEYENCFTISDKARCIAGGVLEAILYLKNRVNNDRV